MDNRATGTTWGELPADLNIPLNMDRKPAKPAPRHKTPIERQTEQLIRAMRLQGLLLAGMVIVLIFGMVVIR